MRTGLGCDRHIFITSGVHLGETRRAADVDDVSTHAFAGASHADKQTLNRFDFRGRGSAVAPREPIDTSSLADLASRPLDHLLTLSMHTAEHVEPRRHLQSDREHAVGDAMEVVDAAVAHERLEPNHAALGERRQLGEVLGNHAPPETEVDECLAGGDRNFCIERCRRRGRWMGVQWHLEYGADTAPCRAAGAGFPSFPLGAAGLIEVDVTVDDARKDNQAAGIDDFSTIRDLTADRCDDAIGDGNLGWLLASREDYGAAANNDGVAHRTSSITISCAPSQSVSLPISGSCSCPCMTVAK